MSTHTFTRYEITCDRVSASDLQEELANDPDATCYSLEIRTDDIPHAEAAQAVVFSVAPRIAITWGADSDWGDCNTSDDADVLAAINEWLNDADAWEARN